MGIISSSFFQSFRFRWRENPNLKQSFGVENKIRINKEIVDFNFSCFDDCRKKSLHQSLDLENPGTGASRFHIETINFQGMRLRIKPSRGVLSPGAQKTIFLHLTIFDPQNINCTLQFDFPPQATRFIPLRIRCDTGVFGVDPLSVDRCERTGIPLVLVHLKQYFLNNGALRHEGIFRLSGDSLDIIKCKKEMNRGNFNAINSHTDVNTLASLIKIWFRELPIAILNNLPAEDIVNSEELDLCVKAYQENLAEYPQLLLEWLLDLLAEVAMLCEVNKMTILNLAIVIAPNLYEPISNDPLQGMAISQKAVTFLEHLLTWRFDYINSPTSTCRIEKKNPSIIRIDKNEEVISSPKNPPSPEPSINPSDKNEENISFRRENESLSNDEKHVKSTNDEKNSLNNVNLNEEPSTPQ